MSNKNVDPTIGALIIGAISTLILNLKIKRKKKTPQSDTEFSLEFSKLSPEQQEEVKKFLEQNNKEVKNEKI